ncbi:DNA methyltransferase [Granulicella arctica]|uniref:DNA methyltransferase n=1 Tax=Granulicella arctica TaxID=940613 RepID=UPI0037BFC4CE
MLNQTPVSINPKRPRKPTGRETWYPFYAGFSQAFAEEMIKSAQLNSEATVLDPWNGSGTTTSTASAQGYRAYGFDINPVSVILAKGRNFPISAAPSLKPLARAILELRADYEPSGSDPLDTWFVPTTSLRLRQIETGIRHLMVESIQPSCISSLAAFFYIALFRSTRDHLAPLRLSNPTWIKRNSQNPKITVPTVELDASFLQHVERMQSTLAQEVSSETRVDAPCEIAIASSEAIPLPPGSINYVLSSPPYCTRIDYGVATMPELAILGFNSAHDLRLLRDSTIGTTTIKATTPIRDPEWGTTCLAFLDAVENHASRASQSYYLKTHLQYFSSIATSLAEISRCLAADGTCCLVVQDSHYKEVYNDLPGIFTEMGAHHGLQLTNRTDFSVDRNLAGIHAHARRYRSSSEATETVLSFAKRTV